MAEGSKTWVAPRGGGYTAVVDKSGKGITDPRPPKGRAAVIVASAEEPADVEQEGRS